ncbi:MAG TPA: hypothetical protein VF628_14075 [Allosphingosinicella sp.]|jgi:hypothetical protein
MRKSVTAALLPMLLGCVPIGIDPEAPTDSIQQVGVEYRRLSSAELRSTVIGATVLSLAVTVSGDNAWRYDPAGYYWNFGHRGVPRRGYFWMRPGLVCHRLGQEEWCDAIYKSQDGRLLRKLIISSAGGNNDFLERIQITPGVTEYPWK